MAGAGGFALLRGAARPRAMDTRLSLDLFSPSSTRMSSSACPLLRGVVAVFRWVLRYRTVVESADRVLIERLSFKSARQITLSRRS
jgi:hypothetical protein